MSASLAIASPAPLLEVRGLVKEFPLRGRAWGRAPASLRAVDGVSFSIAAGETLSLVGESGCGKTTVGRALLRLIEPTAGEVLFAGEDIVKASRARLRELRRDLQVIFQDPQGALNPRLTVGALVGEGLRNFGVGRKERQRQVAELLERVGLEPAQHAGRYPHEFSGGQRQRVGIARALALKPRFVVCDEAVSSLDLSIQAQILNLLLDLQKREGYTYLFISHDLNVVRHLSDRIAVMYLGRLVEIGPAASVASTPHHPYTRMLLNAAPADHPSRRGQWIPNSGELPSALNPPSGCRFHTRCPLAQERCRNEEPPARSVGPDRVSWCFFDS